MTLVDFLKSLTNIHRDLRSPALLELSGSLELAHVELPHVYGVYQGTLMTLDDLKVLMPLPAEETNPFRPTERISLSQRGEVIADMLAAEAKGEVSGATLRAFIAADLAAIDAPCPDR